MHPASAARSCVRALLNMAVIRVEESRRARWSVGGWRWGACQLTACDVCCALQRWREMENKTSRSGELRASPSRKKSELASPRSRDPLCASGENWRLARGTNAGNAEDRLLALLHLDPSKPDNCLPLLQPSLSVLRCSLGPVFPAGEVVTVRSCSYAPTSANSSALSFARLSHHQQCIGPQSCTTLARPSQGPSAPESIFAGIFFVSCFQSASFPLRRPPRETLPLVPSTCPLAWPWSWPPCLMLPVAVMAEAPSLLYWQARGFAVTAACLPSIRCFA